MIVNGPAYCFKCDKVVITKLKESSSSEAKFHSVGAEIRDKLSPGSPILLGKCSICHGAVGRFGYDDCEYEDHESKYAGAPYDKTTDEEKIRKALSKLTSSDLCRSLKEMENFESEIDRELEKRNLTEYWDELEKKKDKIKNKFLNKFTDIDILKYRKPNGGIDWDKYHAERRRKRDWTRKSEFSDKDKEDMK